MPIRWDPLLAAALSRELAGALTGAGASGLSMDGASRRVLLHTDRGTLVLELHPREGWVSLLPVSDPLPESRPLRARVAEVRALPDESAFVVALPRAKRQAEDVELVVELSGNRWNAVLVEGESRAIRQVLVDRAVGRRPLVSGAPYEPPAGTGRASPGSADEWKRLVGGGTGDGSSGGGDPGARATGAHPTDSSRSDLRSALLRSVRGVSSLNVDALLGPDGWELWRAMMDPSRWRGFVVATAEGPQPYPVGLRGESTDAPGEPTVHASLLDAFAAVRARAPNAVPIPALLLPPGVVEGLRERAKGATRKAAALRRQLATGADPDALRAVGDLLLARFSSIPRGGERVTLEGFDGHPVEVELDPTLSPRENAELHYGKAARAEKVRRELPRRIESAEREAGRWERLLETAIRGEATTEEVARALGAGEGSRREKAREKGRGGASRTLPYLRFTSSGGNEIRVGRSAARNDELTLHHSSPDDIWLHVRQSPGAHVVLRWSRKENPPRRELAEAATLAALNSEARHAGTVAVDWTRRKHVRKPRRAPPGSVVVERAETIFVAPDPAVAERLAVRDDAPPPEEGSGA